jgi:hypothetical protein
MGCATIIVLPFEVPTADHLMFARSNGCTTSSYLPALFVAEVVCCMFMRLCSDVVCVNAHARRKPRFFLYARYAHISRAGAAACRAG